MADDANITLLKMEQVGRQNSIHVSPTFLLNGLIIGEASSRVLQQWRICCSRCSLRRNARERLWAKQGGEFGRSE